MGLYSRHILPFCLDKTCGIGPIEKQRAKIVPHARGRVVEIGIGSGHNLPFYNPQKVASVIGVEPDEFIWKRSQSRRKACAFPVTRLGLSGESIPLEDRSADTVVVTYSLCTIPNPVLALREMKRIVKPHGQILFCEHGQAPDPDVHKWQKRIDPIWKRIAGGCHSGRDIPALFEEARLNIAAMEQMYIPGPKILSYNYWGVATP